MSNESALFDLTAEQWAIVRASVFSPELTESEFLYAQEVCRRRGLDPMIGQAYAFVQVTPALTATEKYPARDEARKVVVGTKIDGLRAIAHRSKRLDGIARKALYDKSDSLWGAKCAVWVKGVSRPFVVEVALREYEATNKRGEVIGNWKSKPLTMIFKVAEAHALRMAFPEDMSALYTDDEIAELGGRAEVNVTPEPKTMSKAPKVLAPAPEIPPHAAEFKAFYDKLPTESVKRLNDEVRSRNVGIDGLGSYDWAKASIESIEFLWSIVEDLKARAKAFAELKAKPGPIPGWEIQKILDETSGPRDFDPDPTDYDDLPQDSTFDDQPDDIDLTPGPQYVPVSRYKAVAQGATGAILKSWRESCGISAADFEAKRVTEAQLAALTAAIRAAQPAKEQNLINDNTQAMEAING